MRSNAMTRVLVALVVLAVVSGCRRRGEPARGRVPAPAGGAAAAADEGDGGAGDEGDGGLSIVEDARRYDVRTWSFSLDRHVMKIEDAGMKASLDEVLARTGAELAVNGGFFDPAGKALGLAMSDGVVLSRLSVAMSGGVITSNGESAQLWQTETFALPEGARFAIQCKPRLVVDGKPNVRSDDGKRSERTALCLRDAGKTVDVVIVRDEATDTAGPSLHALGRFLARRGCENALNLDGGPSTGVAWREDGRTQTLRARGQIRHAIVFTKR